jgi:hypothetical protein
MPAYHSGILSQTGRETFTLPLRPTTPNLTLPLGPRNMMVTSPYNIGVTDVRWDNPKLIPQNNGLQIIGVNVYRSINNPYGSYELLNSSPVNVLFYRDQTEEALIIEDATPTIRYEFEPDGKWRIYAMHRPIVIPGTNGETSDRIVDVLVEIDDGDGSYVEVPAFSVSGKIGEIVLISKPVFNPIVKQNVPPRLPWPPNGRVRITYKYLKHEVLSRLQQRIFYKVTTIAVDPNDNSKRLETPIDEMEYRSTFDIEEIDYIWKEAIRRNHWILDQGGERVKVFVRKSMGERCPDYEETHGQSQNDCLYCYGTSYIGGYDGPYDCIIAPPEAEKSIELLDMGLKINYEYESWTGAFPMLRERDVIVRQNNERYVIGPVNYQGSRGATYQQHFRMSYIDERDIRYKIGISGGETQVPADWDRYRSLAPTDASPERPVKPEIDKAKLIRGRTVTFENISYVLLYSIVGIGTLLSFGANIIGQI